MNYNEKNRCCPRILFYVCWFSGRIGTVMKYQYDKLKYNSVNWELVQDPNDNIQKFLHGAMQKYRVPGVAVACIDDLDDCRLYTAGFANSKHVPVTTHTLFQVASLSKPITAWGVMKLHNDGLIDITNPIHDYLISIRLPDLYVKNRITVSQVLSHTAGFGPISYNGEVGKSLYDWKKNLVNMIEQCQDPTQIGRFMYTGLGYSLLQVLIEDITGYSYDKYMENYILRPLGMSHSTFDAKKIIGAASPFSSLGTPIKDREFQEKAAVGLYSNIKDYAKFVICNLSAYKENELPVLKKEQILLLHQRVKREILYGYGFAVNCFCKLRFISHSGHNRGWHAFFAFLPTTNTGIVIMTNGNGGVEVILEILTAWLKNHIEEDTYEIAQKLTGYTHCSFSNRVFKGLFMGWRG